MMVRISDWQDYKILEAISHMQFLDLLKYVNIMHVDFLS
jgi:hypothetical protein